MITVIRRKINQLTFLCASIALLILFNNSTYNNNEEKLLTDAFYNLHNRQAIAIAYLLTPAIKAEAVKLAEDYYTRFESITENYQISIYAKDKLLITLGEPIANPVLILQPVFDQQDRQIGKVAIQVSTAELDQKIAAETYQKRLELWGSIIIALLTITLAYMLYILPTTRRNEACKKALEIIDNEEPITATILSDTRNACRTLADILQRFRQTKEELQLYVPHEKKVQEEKNRNEFLINLEKAFTDLYYKNCENADYEWQQCCKPLKVSEKDIAQAIKNVHGLTMREYTPTIRIRKICDYIDDSSSTTQYNIDELAKIGGFKNESAARKAFKSQKGITLKDYFTKTQRSKQKDNNDTDKSI